MEQIVDFANKYGQTTNRPYFSIDGKTPVNVDQWERMRSEWNHSHGITNVWTEPQVRREERIKLKGKNLHANQKPLAIIERIISATSDSNDVVWEPFGGLCPAALASLKLGRSCFSAEIDYDFYKTAGFRLDGFF